MDLLLVVSRAAHTAMLMLHGRMFHESFLFQAIQLCFQIILHNITSISKINNNYYYKSHCIIWSLQHIANINFNLQPLSLAPAQHPLFPLIFYPAHTVITYKHEWRMSLVPMQNASYLVDN